MNTLEDARLRQSATLFRCYDGEHHGVRSCADGLRLCESASRGWWRSAPLTAYFSEGSEEMFVYPEGDIIGGEYTLSARLTGPRDTGRWGSTAPHPWRRCQFVADRGYRLAGVRSGDRIELLVSVKRARPPQKGS